MMAPDLPAETARALVNCTTTDSSTAAAGKARKLTKRDFTRVLRAVRSR
jgi:hypothetical protein